MGILKLEWSLVFLQNVHQQPSRIISTGLDSQDDIKSLPGHKIAKLRLYYSLYVSIIIILKKNLFTKNLAFLKIMILKIKERGIDEEKMRKMRN